MSFILYLYSSYVSCAFWCVYYVYYVYMGRAWNKTDDDDKLSLKLSATDACLAFETTLPIFPFQLLGQSATVLAASPSQDRPHGTLCRYRDAFHPQNGTVHQGVSVARSWLFVTVTAGEH